MRPDERTLLRDGAKEIGVDLSATEIGRFEIFTEELIRWNAKLNLTALTEITDIIAKHYIDSLTICSLIPYGARLLDIGSGGGFPSIPLKIARPDLDVVSVDSVQKKINFQRQASRLLGIEKFRALHARVEDLAVELGGSFDVVVARAVAEFRTLIRMAVPFLSERGRVMAMKGVRWKEELFEAEGILDATGLVVAEISKISLPVLGDERVIVVLERGRTSSVTETPKSSRMQLQ